MDPMNYTMSNSYSRSNGHYDPVHSASSPWVPHPLSQNPAPYPWPVPNPNLPHLYSHHVGPPAPNSGPDPYSQPAAMLPPLQNLPASGSFSGNMHGPISPRFHSHPQSYRSSMPLPVPPIHASTGSHSHDAAFANQIPSSTDMEWQSHIPGNPGPEVYSMHQSNYPYADSGVNNFGHNHNHGNAYLPQFVSAPQPPPPHFPTPTRRNHPSSGSLVTRGFGGILPSPNRPTPPTSGFRRTNPRQRRSASFRSMAAEVGREDDDGGPFAIAEYGHQSPGGTYSSEETEEMMIRHMQLARGSVSTKMVASKLTLRSLQSVKLEELPEADLSCVICYNEYGVETPEGINEAPLRLPKCGHVFGDHCIKKWFEDSDSCPYCRDKLHSEPKTQPGTSTRAFINLIRSRGGPPSSLGAEELSDILRLRAHYAGDRRIDSPTRHASAQTARRSPPTEGGEHQHRRTRARHGSSSTHDATPLPESRNQTASGETPTQPAAPGIELPSIRQQVEQLPVEGQVQEWRRGNAQAANAVSTTTQDPSTEIQLPPAVLPELSPFPPQEARDQDRISRTLRNPLQAQIGSPYEGLGNNETAPDMPYRSTQAW
jgi:hypothetical protein